MQLNDNCAPLFKRVIFPYFLRVGLSHSRCHYNFLREMLDGRHVASSGASDRHRSRSSSSGVDSNPTVRSSSHRGGLGIARSSSDGRDRL